MSETIKSPDVGQGALGSVPPEVWRIALVIVFGAFMAGLDTSLVNVGLETIGRQLHSSLTSVQWVTSGYLLALAGARTTAIPTVFMTRPIRVGPAAWPRMVWPVGTSSPPQTPWATRSAIRTPSPGARAHRPEVTVNPARAHSHRRPAPR
jgi:hypothetical protein